MNMFFRPKKQLNIKNTTDKEPTSDSLTLPKKHVEVWNPDEAQITEDMIISEEFFNPIFGELLEKEPVSVERLTKIFQEQLSMIAQEEFASNPKKATENFARRSAETLDQMQGALSRNEQWSTTGKGLRLSSLIPAWQKAHFHHKKPEELTQDHIKEFSQNIKTILALEENRPGSTTELNRRFNINVFGRYSKEVLLAQYDTMDKDIPYGIAVFPIADHNGALYGMDEPLTTLHDSLKKPMAVRIIEVDNTAGIPLTFIALDAQYGTKENGNKLSFAIIGGHGGPEGITLDDQKSPKKLQRISTVDLKNEGVGALKHFFKNNAQIILASCSVGRSFAHELHDRTGLTVIGPEFSAAVKEFKAITLKDGSTHIRPEFIDTETNSHVKTASLFSK